jgi:hypothetical protein
MAEAGEKKYEINKSWRFYLIILYLESIPHPEDTSNFAPCKDKHQLLHATEPNRRRRATLT